MARCDARISRTGSTLDDDRRATHQFLRNHPRRGRVLVGRCRHVVGRQRRSQGGRDRCTHRVSGREPSWRSSSGGCRADEHVAASRFIPSDGGRPRRPNRIVHWHLLPTAELTISSASVGWNHGIMPNPPRRLISLRSRDERHSRSTALIGCLEVSVAVVTGRWRQHRFNLLGPRRDEAAIIRVVPAHQPVL